MLKAIMVSSRLCTLAALVACTSAQFATYTQSDHGISVNIPSDTASSKNGPVFMQISAPSGTQWTAFGQGTQMRGANMFVVYVAGNNNVTVSPRLGTGHSMPQFNSNAQVSVLEGSTVNSDGSFVANIRCDSCLSWSGGSMDPSDSSSNWIWAYKSGNALSSTSTSSAISIHDDQGGFSLDLTQGTGGDSINPFLAASSNSAPSGSATGSASTSPTASSTSGTIPIASSSSGASSSSSGSSSGYGAGTSGTSHKYAIRIAHGVIMSVIFVVFFPLASLTLYLPYAQRVRYVHAPLQFLSLVLLIIGLALGVVLGQKVDELWGYHQIIGYVVTALLVLFQPALGIYQHMYYRKTGGRSVMGIAHRWLGRCVIILGVINGGLGFMQSGPVGSLHVPSYSIVAYSIVAGVILVVYLSVVVASIFMSRRKASSKSMEKNSRSSSSSPRMRNHMNVLRH